MQPDMLLIIAPFTQSDWYWIAEDGRIFGSAREGLVKDVDDAALSEWKASRGHGPTTWPRDTDGNQTDAALGEVLAAYGLNIAGYEPKTTDQAGSKSKTSV